LIGLLIDWLGDRPDLKRMFALWIRATLKRKTKYRIVLPEIDDLQELNIMLAERLEQWAHDYKAEGLQEGLAKGLEKGLAKGLEKGLAKGEMLALQKLLSRRFGVIPAEMTARISSATLADIELWFDRAIDAPTLDDVFSQT
ncbi:MAG: hypothetical protein Q7U38_19570, partial [Methylobacter sp.]|nr:hypothetical protein [Methylobacter sp.]